MQGRSWGGSSSAFSYVQDVSKSCADNQPLTLQAIRNGQTNLHQICLRVVGGGHQIYHAPYSVWQLLSCPLTYMLHRQHMQPTLAGGLKLSAWPPLLTMASTPLLQAAPRLWARKQAESSQACSPASCSMML